MSNIYWELVGHSIALTGDGYLDPDNYDPEFDIRCTECQDPQHGGRALIFYEEDFVDSRRPPHVPHERVLRAISEHLAPDMTSPIPEDIVQSAILLAALGDNVSEGIDVFQDYINDRTATST